MSAVEISARTILLWRRFTSKFTDNKFLHVYLRTYGFESLLKLYFCPHYATLESIY